MDFLRSFRNCVHRNWWSYRRFFPTVFVCNRTKILIIFMSQILRLLVPEKSNLNLLSLFRLSRRALQSATVTKVDISLPFPRLRIYNTNASYSIEIHSGRLYNHTSMYPLIRTSLACLRVRTKKCHKMWLYLFPFLASTRHPLLKNKMSGWREQWGWVNPRLKSIPPVKNNRQSNISYYRTKVATYVPIRTFIDLKIIVCEKLLAAKNSKFMCILLFFFSIISHTDTVVSVFFFFSFVHPLLWLTPLQPHSSLSSLIITYNWRVPGYRRRKNVRLRFILVPLYRGIIIRGVKSRPIPTHNYRKREEKIASNRSKIFYIFHCSFPHAWKIRV